MGRLIDADVLIAQIWEEHKKVEEFADELKEVFCGIVALVDEQPTAYNPDEVVQQLEDRSTLSRPVGWSKSYEIVTLEDAIEIVKAGGADA